MADDQVRLRVRISGGLMAERILSSTMREEGVQVLSSTGAANEVERRGSNPFLTTLLADGASVVILIQGGTAAIKAALAKYRESHPKSKVEVEDESGTRLPGYL